MTTPPMSPDLTVAQVAYYRQVLVAHGSVFGASMCYLCGVARCPEWVDAYDRLAAANKLITEVPVWEAYTSKGGVRKARAAEG